MLGLPLPDTLRGAYARFSRVSADAANVADQLLVHALGYDLVAPAWLRYRVQGTPDLRTYLDAGRLSRQSIERALHGLSTRLGDFPRILDFGSGCGRTLRWMRDLAANGQLYGADIDGEAVAWCRERIDFATFLHSQPRPPLALPDGSVDFIYALSVFTHLPADAQLAWLAEFRRLLAPGGMLFLTVLGYRPEKFVARPYREPPRVMGQRILASASLDIWGFLEPEELRTVDRDGFVFIPYRDSVEGREYGVAYHRRKWIIEQFEPVMPVRSYVADGFCDYLDAVILQKPAEPVAPRT